MSRGGLALSRGFAVGVRVVRIGEGFGIAVQPLGLHLRESPAVVIEDGRLSRKRLPAVDDHVAEGLGQLQAINPAAGLFTGDVL